MVGLIATHQEGSPGIIDYDEFDDEFDSMDEAPGRTGVHKETGTVFSTTLNTVCNIMGAGVLALPLATYNASLPLALVVIVVFFIACTYSSYVIVIACEVKQRFSLGAVFAATILREGPPDLTMFYHSTSTVGVGVGGGGGGVARGAVVAGVATTDPTSFASMTTQDDDDTEADHEDDHHDRMTLTTTMSTTGDDNDETSDNDRSLDQSVRPSSLFVRDSNNNNNNSASSNTTAQQQQPTFIQAAAAAAAAAISSAASNSNSRKHSNSNNGNVGAAAAAAARGSGPGSSRSVGGGRPFSAKAVEESKMNKRLVGTSIVDVIILINNFGLLLIYNVVIVTATQTVLESIFNVPADAYVMTHSYVWYLVSGVIFFIPSCARQLTELKWLSLVGILTILWVITCIVWRYADGSFRAPIEQIRTSPAQSTFLDVTNTIGAVALAYFFQYNCPTFYHEMKQRSPKKMLRSMLISLPICCCSYMLAGVIGYLSFGDSIVNSQGDIVNAYPKTDLLINIARVGLVIHFLSVFPLIAVSCRQAVHRLGLCLIGRKRDSADPQCLAKQSRLSIILEAAVIVAFASYTAFLVGRIDVVVGLLGILCGCTVMFTIPGICGIFLYDGTRGEFAFLNAHNCTLLTSNNNNDIVVGGVGVGGGGWVTATSMTAVNHHHHNNHLTTRDSQHHHLHSQPLLAGVGVGGTTASAGGSSSIGALTPSNPSLASAGHPSLTHMGLSVGANGGGGGTGGGIGGKGTNKPPLQRVMSYTSTMDASIAMANAATAAAAASPPGPGTYRSIGGTSRVGKGGGGGGGGGNGRPSETLMIATTHPSDATAASKEAIELAGHSLGPHNNPYVNERTIPSSNAMRKFHYIMSWLMLGTGLILGIGGFALLMYGDIKK